jgi:mannose-6-phosphate isomerase-like protein (cupin superfamily)
MHAPVGWTEPIIEAEFEIRGIVLSGSLGLQFKDSTIVILKNSGFYIPRGERVRIFNSGKEELVLIEVLTPAYEPQRVRQFDRFD